VDSGVGLIGVGKLNNKRFKAMVRTVLDRIEKREQSYISLSGGPFCCPENPATTPSDEAKSRKTLLVFLTHAKVDRTINKADTLQEDIACAADPGSLMSLNKEQIDAFKRQFKALKPGRKGKFIYCPKGPEGDPVLRVDRKRIPSGEVRELRMTAKEKRFVKGEVELSKDKKQITFFVKKKNALLERHVKKFYGKFIPKLKSAVFVLQAAAPQIGDVEAPQEEEAAPGAFDALGTKDIKSELGTLRAALEKAIADRLALEPRLYTLKNDAAEMKQSLTTRASNRKAKEAERDEVSEQITALVAEENRIRELLQEGEAQLTQRIVEDIDEETPEEVSADALETQQLRADAAERDEVSSRAELAEKERRMRELQAKQKSKAIEQERARKAGKPVSEETMHKISEEERVLQAELAVLRESVDEKLQQRLIERARSESMLDVWSDAQAEHWKEMDPARISADNWAAIQSADHTFIASQDQADVLQKQLTDALAAQKGLGPEAEQAQRHLAAAEADIALKKKLLEKIKEKINSAGLLTNTAGLEKKLEETARALRKQEGELGALQDHAAKLTDDMEERREELAEQIERLEDDLEDCRNNEQGARANRGERLLSEEEKAHVETLETKVTDIQKQEIRLREQLEEATEAEREALAEVDRIQRSRKAYEEAHKKLSMAKLKRDQLKEVASRHRGLRRQKGKKLIDEARAELPDADLELEAAQALFAEAEATLQQAQDNSRGSRAQDAEEATDKRLEIQKKLAEKQQFLTQAEQRLAEEDARVSGLIGDIAHQKSKTCLADLVDMTAEDDPARLEVEAVKVRKDAAKALSIATTDTLINHELSIQTLSEEVEALSAGLATEETDPTQLKNKLNELRAARTVLLDQRLAASSAATAHEDTTAELAAARQVLIDQAQASDDEILKEKVRELNGYREHLKDARDVSDRALARDVDALHHLDSATDALTRARSADDVAHTRAELSDFISEQQGLVEHFHKLRDPTGDEASQTFDLMSEAGRKAAKKAMGDDFEQILVLQAELEQRAVEMIRRGATFEDLTGAFARIPNGLRPPSYRAEVAAFAQLEDAFQHQDDEDAIKAQDDRILELARQRMSPEEMRQSAEPMLKKLGIVWDDLYKNFNAEWEKSGVKATTGKLLKSAKSDGADGAAEMLKVIGVLGVAAHGLSVVKKTGELGTYLTTDTDKMDPLQQKEYEDKLLGQLSGLFSSSVKLGRDIGTLAVGPNPASAVLGTLHFSKELALHIMEVSARRAKSRWDGLLMQAAAVASSPLSSAFEESLNREQRLLTGLGVEISLDATRIAASITQAFPPVAVFGIAVQLSAWGVSKLSQEMFAYKDAKLAQKSKQLLDAARQGDDAAKTELFKNHPRYAKGLIAYMALQEKDSFALTYVSSRGLSESDIENQSLKILSRYLLTQAKQTANMPDLGQFTEKWRSRMSTAKSVMIYAIPLFGQIKAGVDLTNAVLAISPHLDPAEVDKLREAEQAAREVLDDRQALERLIAKVLDKLDKAETDDDRNSAQASLLALRRLDEEYQDLFMETIDQASANLDQIKELGELLADYEGTHEARLTRDKRKELVTARAWLGQLRTAESSIIQHVARAAA
jgi:hypothetical protein